MGVESMDLLFYTVYYMSVNCYFRESYPEANSSYHETILERSCDVTLRQ